MLCVTYWPSMGLIYLKKVFFIHVLDGENSALLGFSVTRYCRIWMYLAFLGGKVESSIGDMGRKGKN